jgi:hypothetical protein
MESDAEQPVTRACFSSPCSRAVHWANFCQRFSSLSAFTAADNIAPVNRLHRFLVSRFDTRLAVSESSGLRHQLWCPVHPAAVSQRGPPLCDDSAWLVVIFWKVAPHFRLQIEQQTYSDHQLLLNRNNLKKTSAFPPLLPRLLSQARASPISLLTGF